MSSAMDAGVSSYGSSMYPLPMISTSGNYFSKSSDNNWTNDNYAANYEDDYHSHSSSTLSDNDGDDDDKYSKTADDIARKYCSMEAESPRSQYPLVPKPSLSSSYLRGMFDLDPALSLTPEKRIPTYVRLRCAAGESPLHSELSLNRANKDGVGVRESRVHFDPDVAVLQFSPNCSSSYDSSPINSSLSSQSDYSPSALSNDWNKFVVEGSGTDDHGYNDYTMSKINEDDYDRYDEHDQFNGFTRDSEKAAYRSSQEHISDLNDDDDDLSLFDENINYSSPTDVTDLTGSNLHGLTVDDDDDDEDARSIDKPVLQNVLRMNASLDPISVVASDLRKPSSSTSKPTVQKPKSAKHSSVKSKSMSLPRRQAGHRPMRSFNSLPAMANHEKIVLIDSKSKLSPRGLTASHSAELLSSELDALEREETECALAKPELNSTLKISKDIARLREKGFNASDALKSKVDEKTKAKIDEKAQLKLNQRLPQFTNLVSLDVHKDELLQRITDEKVARVRPEPSGDRLRREDLVTRIPDIIDFFTSDLQKESVSYSLPGITMLHVPAQTVESVRAFDVYRHTRHWQQL